MIDVVIIAHNQADSVKPMFDNIPYWWNVIYVADRCTDNTREEVEKHGKGRNLQLLERNSGEGRKTSELRNLGFRHTRPCADVLFLDGDRYAADGSLAALEEWQKDVALLMLERDNREDIPDYQTVYGQVHNAFYSCGLFIKRAALEKIREFQKGEIFREDMQAMWGIEDTYLGDVCFHLGLTCDIYRGCRLTGEFSKVRLDSLDAVEKRLFERDKLNVRWDG